MTGIRKHILPAALTLLASSSSALADDPLSSLAPNAGDSACFAREYDAAHLRRHPGQTTNGVMLSYKNEDPPQHPNVRIMIRRNAHKSPLYIVGYCAWTIDKANRTVQDKPILNTFRKKSGADCIAATDKDSEEGGYFLIDVSDGGRGLMLHLDERLQAWGNTDLAREPDLVEFAGEDRVFKLSRTRPEACATMEKNLTVKWLVPDQK